MGVVNSKGENPRKKNYRLAVLTGHESGVNAMAVSEDCSVLATGSDDKTVRLWTTRFNDYECIGVLIGHEGYVTCIVIEDIYVISGSSDKTIRKWDMSNGGACVQVYRGHKSIITRILSTGDFLFSSSYDRTARCWDFDSGECIRVFTGHKRGVYPMMFIPAEEGEEDDDDDDEQKTGNHDLLITGSADHTAIVWSFETGQPIHVLKEHTGTVTCMATDPHGKVLVTGSTDQTIRSWNILKGQLLRVFLGHQSSVTCVTVVNKLVYSGSADHTGRSWVLEFGDCARIYRGHEHTVATIKHQDGIVYTGSGDGFVMCFDSKSGSLLRTFKYHTGGVNAIQVLSGKLLSASHDGTVGVWDTTGLRDDMVYRWNVDEGKTTTGRNSIDDEGPFTPWKEDETTMSPSPTTILNDHDEDDLMMAYNNINIKTTTH